MAEQVKRKRGRPRKNKLPEEIQQLVQETQQKVQEEQHKTIEETLQEVSSVVEKKSSEWDVPLGQEIKFFDKELSYELTGYKPINETKGLDFDPSWFTETRDTFIRTGRYCQYHLGSKAFHDFWREQYKRCKYGYTVNGYTVTGDHYYFLNFYQLKDLYNVEEAGSGRNEIFPNFFEGQYEWFHYLALAKKLKMNACMMKAREAGYSEIEASIIAKSYTVIKGSVNVCCAFADTQLSKLWEKIDNNLSFLDRYTDGGFSHGRLTDTTSLKRAGQYEMKNGKKVPSGWGSQIQAIVVDKPGKLRGDRTDILMFEECFGKGTRVVMSDYSIKNIEDIKVGDFVLGLDGTPQAVVHTTKGIDNLYKIKQKRGNDYVVNSKHKLYLEWRPRVGKQPDQITLKTVSQFRELSAYNQRTSYGKTNSAINNKEDVCKIDPYYLGAWLGDGWSESPSRIIVNIEKDPEIYNYVINYFQSINLDPKITKCDNTDQCVRIYGSTNRTSYNPLNQLFKEYNLINNKHIPKQVYFSTLDYKLQVLAGLIDTDGNINKNLRYEFSSCSKNLTKQVALLARSCGFDVSESVKKVTKGFSIGNLQYRLQIKGNIVQIPVKVARKVCTNTRFNTTNSTGITIEDLGQGEYFGITLKSYNKETDNLFLLEDFTIVHNCGIWPNFTKAYTMADALVGQIGSQWGLRLLGGTGGESGAAVEGLRKVYYNPEIFGVLPFKHRYTQTGEEAVTAFFLPAFKTIKDLRLLDHRGFISDEDGKKYFDKFRAIKAADPKELVTYCAEYCYNGEEAFSLEGDNKFNKVNIAEQLTRIRALKQCPPIETGFLEYAFKDGKHAEENINGFKWIPNQNGKIKILEHPIWTLPQKTDEDGKVIWSPPSEKIRNLYVIGIDGIDIGKAQTSEYTKDPSDFCLTVFKRTYGMGEPQFVAMYKDRPNDVRECYKIAIKLAQYYNAVINIEATRQSIIPYARERKLLKLFMRRPRATLTDSMINTNKQYGTPATPAIIDHQTDLMADYVNDYCHLIWFDEMLDELNRYTDENKRKFDIVVAACMALLADEELQGMVPKMVETKVDTWEQIGYYTDEQGRRRYGTIPKKNNQILVNNNFGQLYDDNRIRTSNTRLLHGYLW